MSHETLPNWLQRAAEHWPERLALKQGGEQWTFAELNQRARDLALRLAAAGVGAGTRVAVLAANSLEYAACVHALALVGAVLVPLNTRLALEELRWQLQDVRAEVVLHDAQHAPQTSELRQRIPVVQLDTLARHAKGRPVLPRGGAAALRAGSPPARRGGPAQRGDAVPVHAEEAVALGESAALDRGPVWRAAAPQYPGSTLRGEIDLGATQAIVYTSGTTGRPKGALITFGMQWWSAVGSALHLGMRPDDCWLACLPLYHIGGLAMLLKNVIYGVPVLVFERFDAVAVNLAITAEGVTHISVVAAMLQRMLDALDATAGAGARYPASLRCVLLGGGPAPRPLLEDCVRRGIPVAQTYGLTESCSQAATLSPADALRKLGSAGRPLASVQLRVVHDGAPAGANQAGEIELRGPTITPGYADRPEATAQALRNGWLSTGDIGYLDEEGYLYVLDRRSDLIVSGGENVYPAEIEAVLLDHPQVLEAGVCGVADERWGRAPLAFVHPRPGLTPSTDELRAFLAERLAHYKVPREIHLVGPLPRSAAGKLLRRDLPRLLAAEGE
jgi:O-succinylbenzoic acid--CoA ligase